MNLTSIELEEWQTIRPEPGTELAGLSFGDDEAARLLAESLSRAGRLEITELRTGIAISASSFVGRVQIGPLRITVKPKIDALPLLGLLRYAYGLRDLNLHADIDFYTKQHGFSDLLVWQLMAEVTELVTRGLHREYVRIEESLASPRGRLDIQRYVRRAGVSTAVLPCTHHPRLQDELLNRTLLSGVRFAATVTDNLPLRARLRRLSSLLETMVKPLSLSHAVLDHAERQVDRRTVAYRPALQIIGLLLPICWRDVR